MKRYQILCLLFFYGQIGHSQFIDNKLDVSVAVITETPKGIKTSDGLPSLFANYESTYGFMLNTNYKITKTVGFGLDYLQSSFNRNSVESFPSIQNPNSIFKNLLLSANFTWGRRLEFGGNISAGPCFHKLKTQQLIIPAEQPVSSKRKNFRETEFSFMPGLRVSFHHSNEIKSTLGVNYRYTTANNLLYSDDNFQSLIVYLGVTKKLLKNVFFQYD